MRTAVLIVSYNARADLHTCLQRLRATGARPESIFVVDNGSEDGSAALVAAEHAGVRLLANAVNRYYAAATNQALDRIDADFILLLNPDTRPDFEALAALLAQFTADPRLAAVAPQLRYADGRVQHSCRRFPDWRTPWRELAGRGRPERSHWKMADFDHTEPRHVDQPMFSCIWIRAAALTAVGPLDPAYPLFFNDVDWCLRAHAAGWRILFDPAVAVEHRVGGVTRHYPWRRLWHAHRGFARFLWRRRGRVPAALLGILGVWLVFPLRALRSLLQQQ